jgi:hypothetical protein
MRPANLARRQCKWPRYTAVESRTAASNSAAASFTTHLTALVERSGSLQVKLNAKEMPASMMFTALIPQTRALLAMHQTT